MWQLFDRVVTEENIEKTSSMSCWTTEDSGPTRIYPLITCLNLWNIGFSKNEQLYPEVKVDIPF